MAATGWTSTGSLADSLPTVIDSARIVREFEAVIPANLGAIKMALLALSYEDNNDMDGAQKYWITCFNLLNQQMKEHRGAARYVPNLKLYPAGSGFPSTD